MAVMVVKISGRSSQKHFNFACPQFVCILCGRFVRAVAQDARSLQSTLKSMRWVLSHVGRDKFSIVDEVEYFHGSNNGLILV